MRQSPSIIWNRSVAVVTCNNATGKLVVGLTSHWPYVTDMVMGYVLTYGFSDLRDGDGQHV